MTSIVDVITDAQRRSRRGVADTTWLALTIVCLDQQDQTLETFEI